MSFWFVPCLLSLLCLYVVLFVRLDCWLLTGHINEQELLLLLLVVVVVVVVVAAAAVVVVVVAAVVVVVVVVAAVVVVVAAAAVVVVVVVVAAVSSPSGVTLVIPINNHRFCKVNLTVSVVICCY